MNFRAAGSRLSFRNRLIVVAYIAISLIRVGRGAVSDMHWFVILEEWLAVMGVTNLMHIVEERIKGQRVA